MKKILLACAAGLSTSMLVQKMKDYAKEKGIDVKIEAMPSMRITDDILETIDALLLGPQVRYELDNFQSRNKTKIPIEVIDMTDYGTMNGENVLKKMWGKIK